MGEAGAVFSFDVMMAFVVIVFIIYLALSYTALAVSGQVREVTRLELELKGSVLADALVKNRNPENPLLGSAHYSPEKKRVESNVIDWQLLLNARPDAVVLGKGMKVRELYFKPEKGEKQVVFVSEKNGDCLFFERFVLVKGVLPVKGKLVLGVCDE